MNVTDDSASSKTQPLAHGRPAVERWLAWSGLVPLPLFLLFHVTRELALGFTTDVSDVVRSAPSLPTTLVAWLLVWLPLAVHLGLGAWFLATGRKLSPPPGEDVPAQARLLSRVSTLPALAFVAYHAQKYPLATWFGEADARDAGFRLIAELSSTRFGVPLVGAVYLLGLLVTATHVGLALHRALLVEGLLSTPERRQTSARACAAFGSLLFSVGAAAVIRVASGALLR